MILIIGGKAQGKTEYARKVYEGQAEIFDDFQDWFRESLLKDDRPEEKVREYISANPREVIISDEVGNGVIPMDPFERKYREELGRTLIMIAEKADSVIRIFCGIPQKIK